MRLSIEHPDEVVSPINYRNLSESKDPAVLADIYELTCNIAVCKRALDRIVMMGVDKLLQETHSFRVEEAVTPESVRRSLLARFAGFEYGEALSNDIGELVDMFCCLFDLKRAGLRLTKLEHAMCPRFHTDKVPCRLVSTYSGLGTQWLPHESVDRSKLGDGNNGLSDDRSGIYRDDSDIRQLTAGDVALLKGELWEGNENAGLVHRSPGLQSGEKRLLLTLDFIG